LLTKRVDELEAKLAAAKKTSSNSSKPPSSDIVKPSARSKLGKKRKQGGQKGHQRVVRPEIPSDELDWLMLYSYDFCPDCGGQRWLERIWTLTATCSQTGRSLLDVIRGCVTAHFQGDLPPPLIPAT